MWWDGRRALPRQISQQFLADPNLLFLRKQYQLAHDEEECLETIVWLSEPKTNSFKVF